MYALLNKGKELNLAVDLRLKLFDSLVLPIICYGSELYGFQEIKEFERLHLHYLKSILGVPAKTTNLFVYGETGRLPLKYRITKGIISFWMRTITRPDNSLLKTIFDALQRDSDTVV